MARQDSSDMEVEDDWEDASDFPGLAEESNIEGLDKSCDSYQEKNVDKIHLSQQLDEMVEYDGKLRGEKTREEKSLVFIKPSMFPESLTQDATSVLSSDLISSSVSSKILCEICFNKSDPITNQTNEGLNVCMTSEIHDSNYDILQSGQKETYCLECNKPLCYTDSKLHSNESETHRATIAQFLREMSERESVARKKLEAMDYESTEFLRKASTLQNDINRRRIELKDLVDRHADTLLVEVDSWREEVSSKQVVEMEALRGYVDSLESYKASCKKILVDGSPGDIEQVAGDLEKKETELRPLPKKEFQGLFHGFRLSLKQTNIEDFFTDYYNNNSNIVGFLEAESDIQDFEQISEEKKISSTCNFPTIMNRMEKCGRESKQRDLSGERIVYREDPILVGTLRTHAAVKEDKGILGVAFLEDELFVVSRESSEVEVFDCRRFIFSCELDLDCLLNPEDIGSCPSRKCLYIMDRKRHRSRSEILRVDTDGNLIKRWSTGGQWGRISVTSDTNILLCIYKTAMLNEYNADGILLRVIQFPPEAGLEHPRHAIRLTSGHYLVGHGETGDSVHRVIKVDTSGKVVGSFRGSSEEDMMKRPFYLAPDPEGQCVLVADADNRRVLMLNSALELKRELLSADRQGLRYPARICIDTSSGLLFVADNKVGDKRILVFLIR